MHHSRRRSGHSSANTSYTDVRKAASGEAKHKSRSSTKKSPSQPSRPSKERDWMGEDDGESFPQFCMTCEKQFVPCDDREVYCSDICRRHDSSSSSSSSVFMGSFSNNYPLYPSDAEPRDIVPRASPSRPVSTHFSSPNYHNTPAVSALRSLNVRPVSPSSPTGMVWPFGRSAATSPSTSYNRGGSNGYFSSTYDTIYTNTNAPSHYGYNTYSTNGMDRPLPSRRPGMGSRPKSIELVTPMVGR